MNLAERFQQTCPGRFFLDGNDVGSLSSFLKGQGWVAVEEEVLSAGRAGEGNMNYALRVTTNKRTFILKQARPWVEKYPSIDAPDERAIVEAAFYRVVESEEGVASHMPRLLASDDTSRMLMLEDLGEASDCTDVYDARLSASELDSLIAYLNELHAPYRSDDLQSAFANRRMRELNHEHIFALPLRPGNGLNLDAITPGLEAAAVEIRSDSAYCARVAALGRLYLGDMPCLLHGDFFPGSWLRTAAGLKVIDPEFCFCGKPEFDFGVFLAHMLLSGASPAAVDQVQGSCRHGDWAYVRRFAGVEIMRRLIGVAQLPLTYGIEEKHRLLQLSRQLVSQ